MQLSNLNRLSHIVLQTAPMASHQIYLWEGMFLSIGPGLHVLSHKSHALEIGISLDHPFHIQGDNGSLREAKGIMIAPDQHHQCALSIVGQWAHIGLERESDLARHLIATRLAGAPFIFFSNEAIDNFTREIKRLSIDSDVTQMTTILQNFLEQLWKGTVSASGKSKDLDYRIAKVIRLLKETNAGHPSLRELSEHVNLSEGRLVHLFKEQVGIPIRRYLLWLKVNRAIMEMIASQNLTDAALKAGFADSAHFSRTFLQMFGMPPSKILTNSQIIQAFHVSVA